VILSYIEVVKFLTDEDCEIILWVETIKGIIDNTYNSKDNTSETNLTHPIVANFINKLISLFDDPENLNMRSSILVI
jgi:hypothetical protein